MYFSIDICKNIYYIIKLLYIGIVWLMKFFSGLSYVFFIENYIIFYI